MAGQRSILCSRFIEVLRNAESKNKIASTVWCIKIFSGISQTSSSVGLLKLYTLHIINLNIAKDQLRKQLVSRRTVVASLPATFRLLSSALVLF